MLKIYVYGCLNRVQSSRRLELECQHNIELIWLTGRLAPDFKTIADSLRDNGNAIRKVCREFVMLCIKIGLLSAANVNRVPSAGSRGGSTKLFLIACRGGLIGTRKDGSAPPDSRTPLPHDQGVDGCDTLPNAQAAERRGLAIKAKAAGFAQRRSPRMSMSNLTMLR